MAAGGRRQRQQCWTAKAHRQASAAHQAPCPEMPRSVHVPCVWPARPGSRATAGPGPRARQRFPTTCSGDLCSRREAASTVARTASGISTVMTLSPFLLLTSKPPEARLAECQTVRRPEIRHVEGDNRADAEPVSVLIFTPGSEPVSVLVSVLTGQVSADGGRGMTADFVCQGMGVSGWR